MFSMYNQAALSGENELNWFYDLPIITVIDYCKLSHERDHEKIKLVYPHSYSDEIMN